MTMAGYKPARKLLNMTFVDYPGLEITAQTLALGKLLELNKLQGKLSIGDNDALLQAFTQLAECITAWNMLHPEVPTEDGICLVCGLQEDDALPTTVQGLCCLDLGFVTFILTSWIELMVNLPSPKDGSSNGGRLPDMNTMMSMLGGMQNQPTLPMPN